MRSSRRENLSEHSLEVAMIAHALCTIANVRYGRSLDAERAALIGLYHDASEIITGDMPTPVKYSGREIQSAYKAVEAGAEAQLMDLLPDDLKASYVGILGSCSHGAGEDGCDGSAEMSEEELYMRRLVKGADKLSALIKCMEEENTGNREFATALQSTKKAIDELTIECPEVGDFVRDFLPSYGSTLDELLQK